MRYEKKILFNNSYLSLVKSLISHYSLKKIYKERNIYSIYYDSDDFCFFHDSIDGNPKRKKIRLRWYDQNHEEIKLEIKSKIYELGEKKIIDLISKKDLISVSIYSPDISDFKINIPRKIENINKPKTAVLYKRSYYTDFFEKFRVTLDYKIHFSKFIYYPKISNLKFLKSENCFVLEIKYQKENEREALLFMNSISNQTNNTFQNYSKYAQSILSSY